MTTSVYKTTAVSMDDYSKVLDEIIKYSLDKDDAERHFARKLDVEFPDNIQCSNDILTHLPELNNHIIIIDSETIKNDREVLIFAPWLALRNEIEVRVNDSSETEYFAKFCPEEANYSPYQQRFNEFAYIHDGLFRYDYREVNSAECCIDVNFEFVYADDYDDLPEDYHDQWSYGD
jgi:hypothetical protein